MSRSDRRRAIVIVALLGLAAGACGPKLSREEEIELLRSQYTAELKSLTVKQDPVAGAGDPAGVPADGSPTAPEALAGEAASDSASEDGAAVAPEAADGAGADAGAIDATGAAAVGVRTDVILDILVSTTSQEYLAGVTVDVEHVDADRQPKDRRTLWVDTSGLVRGGGTQVTHVLENVDWQAGDGFFVEIRTPIPAAERSEYREFQAE